MSSFLAPSISGNFWRYVIVGVLNTVLNLTLLNLFIFITGATKGVLLVALSVLAFCITLGHSYMWNRLWVFRDAPRQAAHRQLGIFSAISITTAIVGNSILYILTTLIGPLGQLSPTLWVNVIVVVLIPISFLGNYFGHRFLVFKKDSD